MTDAPARANERAGGLIRDHVRAWVEARPVRPLDSDIEAEARAEVERQEQAGWADLGGLFAGGITFGPNAPDHYARIALERIAHEPCDHGPGFCAREVALAALRGRTTY